MDNEIKIKMTFDEVAATMISSITEIMETISNVTDVRNKMISGQIDTEEKMASAIKVVSDANDRVDQQTRIMQMLEHLVDISDFDEEDN